jgi:protein-L-isoaspartate(D-aspartate) O-methyltransferase
VFLPGTTFPLITMTLDDCRRFYAQEMRFAAGLTSPALIEAYARVPREKYLGPPPWWLVSADARALSVVGKMSLSYVSTEDPRDLYHNVVVSIDRTKDINNGQPSALAWWIKALELMPGDRACHLGCGVGYYTAIMAEVVGPHGSMLGIEVDQELARQAKQNLAEYPNATVQAADGVSFDPGPFDAMLVNAGVTHPQPLWIDRLRDGGRLVLPLTLAATPTIGQGIMAKITRRSGSFAAEMVTPVAVYSCVGGRDPELESQMRKALTTGGIFKLKALRRDAHEPTETCLLHRSDVCVSSADAQ